MPLIWSYVNGHSSGIPELEFRRETHAVRHSFLVSLAHNRDDHAKNHAFLMSSDGSWRLSPAYDLTYSNGPGGEHSTPIAGKGRTPKAEHLLTIAHAACIRPGDAKAVIERVRSTINDWPLFADQAGLSTKRTKELDLALNGKRTRWSEGERPST